MSKTFLKKVTFFSFFSHLVILLVFSGCSNSSTPVSPDESNGSDHRYAYSVAINALHKDSILFSLSAYSSRDFVLPYHFFDNPVHQHSDTVVHHLSVTDFENRAISYSTSLVSVGPIQNTVLHLNGTISYPVTITYTIDPEAIGNDEPLGLDAATLTDSTLLYLGNAIFIVPFISTSLEQFWRTDAQISVSVHNRSSASLFGIPSSSTFTCKNIYELLFTQLFMCKSSLYSGSGGGIQFTLLESEQNLIPKDSLSMIGNNFTSILDMIKLQYGNFFNDNLTVHFSKIGGGLEGQFSFIQRDCSDPSFYYVLAHEALHQFIGIRCGEYDDPWWKEGATSYLSYLIAVRLGLYSKDRFSKYISTKFAFPDSSSFNIALSEPWLRSNMFPSGKWDIVYTKGAQVMMLLDYKTREASENRYSIEDVMSYLVKHYDGSAFHRKDLLDAFTKFGNSDVQNIFSTYIDIAGEHPSDSLLAVTYAKLDSLGAFGGNGSRIQNPESSSK
jgi:hypothetical protein